MFADSIQRLVSFYHKWKFGVKEILADGQFHSSQTALADLHINLNCVSMDVQVPEAEILIRTLKEHCRCSLHNTPFLKLPKWMVVRLLQNVMFYLNTFPHTNIVSDLALLTIVQGKVLDFILHRQVEFKAYTQTRNLTENKLPAHDQGYSNRSQSQLSGRRALL